MLKTKILYQLNQNNSVEIAEYLEDSSFKINGNRIFYFVQVISNKPIGIFNEQQ